MSSRNQRLTSEQRKIAPTLYQALREGERLIRSGSRAAVDVKRAALEILSRNPVIRVQYLEVVDPSTFQPVDEVRGAVRIVAAVWLGEVRLIDNILVS